MMWKLWKPWELWPSRRLWKWLCRPGRMLRFLSFDYGHRVHFGAAQGAALWPSVWAVVYDMYKRY